MSETKTESKDLKKDSKPTIEKAAKDIKSPKEDLADKKGTEEPQDEAQKQAQEQEPGADEKAAKEAADKQYIENYNAYTDLKGAFPSSEWSHEELAAELAKELDLKAKVEAAKQPTVEQIAAIKKTTHNYNPNTHVLIRTKRDGHVRPISIVQWNLVKKSGEVELYSPSLPELDNK